VTLKRELGRTLRSQRHLGLLMLDLDDFKRFNDIHGHPMGDELLRTIAILLGQSVRTVDAVARYGGEEFAVILPEVEIAEAGRVAERLRRLVAELPLSPAQSGRVTISLGVAVAPDHGHTVEALVQAADRALYQAKRAGKNRVAIYDPEAAAPARTGL
jgi:diguanylate cyclase (GGDEF)-like protein